MSFDRACAVADVAPGYVVRRRTSTAPTWPSSATATTVYAIHDECSHAAVALSEGEVDGCTIECWLHGSRFDLRTGKPTGPPATEPVPIYPVRVDGDDVLVDVSNPINPTN